MRPEGAYAPNALKFAAGQVELCEKSGGREGTTLQGKPVVIITMRGNKTGKTRKVPLMRVEHGGTYAIVASMGGAPKHPAWYYNVREDLEVRLQDGPDAYEMRARDVHGDEKAQSWGRAAEAWPAYAAYQQRTERATPVFVLEKR